MRRLAVQLNASIRDRRTPKFVLRITLTLGLGLALGLALSGVAAGAFLGCSEVEGNRGSRRVPAARGGEGLVVDGKVGANAGAANGGSAPIPEPPLPSEETAVGAEPGSPSARCIRPTSGTEIYERRIAPLLADDRPKSCNQCHLSGVDIGLFVRPTACETMACLIELELVDLDEPQASTVLGWIGRAAPTSPLITAEVIQAEHAGFLEWIEHSAECFSDECAGVTCQVARSAPRCNNTIEPTEFMAAKLDRGGCSDLELERLFLASVYASRGRCFPCHFSEQERAAPNAPRFIEQLGTCEHASLVTMRNVINSGLIDRESPAKSLLLLKPLAEEAGGVAHGGHDKFSSEMDPAYRNFRYWIERYAECAGEGS